MPQTADRNSQIVTHSAAEALDFAASLLSGGIESEVQATPSQAAELATLLARYTQYRYVGELSLAYEALEDLASLCRSGGYRESQFWAQLKWAASSMQLESALSLKRP